MGCKQHKHLIINIICGAGGTGRIAARKTVRRTAQTGAGTLGIPHGTDIPAGNGMERGGGRDTSLLSRRGTGKNTDGPQKTQADRTHKEVKPIKSRTDGRI